MANALDMVAGVGQFGFDPLGDFVEGKKARSYLDELKRTDKARGLTGAALQGDQNSLRGLAGVDPDAFMAVSKYQQKDPSSDADRIASLVNWADTPEKWQQAVQRIQASGLQLSPEELDFNNRGAMLAEYTTLKEQQALAGKDPASVQEYEYAKKNGFTGSFMDWKQSGGGGEYGLNPVWGTDEQGKPVLFQLPKAGGPPQPVQFPQGFTPRQPLSFLNTGTSYVGVNRRTGEPEANTPIDAAGKAQATEVGKGMGERALARPQAELTLKSTFNALDRLANEARAIKENPALPKITGWAGMVPNAPGGEAAGVQARLQTLKSQIAFTVLQAMRDASKTGGALGSVSDAEGARLENNLAALDQAQSSEDFQRALGQIIDYAESTKGNLRNAFAQTYSGQQGGQQQPQTQPQGPGQGFNEGDYFGSDADVPEGAIVVDDEGTAFKKINGQLVPVQ